MAISKDSTMDAPKETVHVVIRFDPPFDPGDEIENKVTIKAVYRNIETAVAEAERLNALNAEKGCRYWMQTTRLLGGKVVGGP